MLQLFILLLFAGCMFVYLSNKHQLCLAQPLAKPNRYVGYTLAMASLVVLWQGGEDDAAFFFWLFALLTVLTVVPCVCLLTRRND